MSGASGHFTVAVEVPSDVPMQNSIIEKQTIQMTHTNYTSEKLNMKIYHAKGLTGGLWGFKLNGVVSANLTSTAEDVINYNFIFKFTFYIGSLN